MIIYVLKRPLFELLCANTLGTLCHKSQRYLDKISILAFIFKC